MLKKLFLFLVALTIFTSETRANNDAQYPDLTGKALFELRTDRVTSTNKNGVDDNNADINVDADFNLKMNKNWSVISDWRIRPVFKRGGSNPERYREILSASRGFGQNDDGLIIEQLKAQYENEDARFFVGKFNPAFGTAFRKEKRIGVFTTDFTKDYEIREKLGAGVTALLEKSELTVDFFTNDTTPLSNSALNRRGEEKKSDGLAGNTSGPSSFTIAIEGEDLFGINDLYYNFGYRNLSVDKTANSDDEKGFVAGAEYSIPLSTNTSLIPFVEFVSIDNLSGIASRDATYTTLALIAKYSGWTTSVSNVKRKIDSSTAKYNDYQVQFSVGYKFDNNIAIDVSKANIKEDGNKGSLIGAIISYIYNF